MDETFKELMRKKERIENFLFAIVVAFILGGWLALYFLCQYTFDNTNNVNATRKELGIDDDDLEQQ